MTAATTPGPQNAWTALARIASPHRGTFALVALLALLAAVAELLAPVIYREAVNDIAGLFVGNPGSTGIDQMKSLLPPDDPAVDSAPAAAVPHARPRTAHTRGHVAPRTAEQALTTLLWAAGLLFALNVLSHYLSLSADQRTVVLASRIEADVIQGTFAHVLRQPLSFFARRSTGSLAKQIDQSDQISPIVTAFAHQVMPEVITACGVVVIMLVQSWRLALVALVTLPPYIWLAHRSSKRLETGLGDYYGMWDGVSTRIHDALAAVKTVKLSGAEHREAAGLRRASDDAYATLVERNRLANRFVFWQSALNYLSQALVLGYGGFLVFRHQLTPGDVVMFVAYLDRHNLPRHPLVAKGYPSIGCLPCTSPVKPGENARAGRWRGRGKTECGIHTQTLDAGQDI